MWNWSLCGLCFAGSVLPWTIWLPFFLFLLFSFYHLALIFSGSFLYAICIVLVYFSMETVFVANLIMHVLPLWSLILILQQRNLHSTVVFSIKIIYHGIYVCYIYSFRFKHFSSYFSELFNYFYELFFQYHTEALLPKSLFPCNLNCGMKKAVCPKVFC